jgi:hypothetical protein
MGVKLKVVLLGESAVGKSSIGDIPNPLLLQHCAYSRPAVQRYIKGDFLDKSAPTVGGDPSPPRSMPMSQLLFSLRISTSTERLSNCRYGTRLAKRISAHLTPRPPPFIPPHASYTLPTIPRPRSPLLPRRQHRPCRLRCHLPCWPSPPHQTHPPPPPPRRLRFKRRSTGWANSPPTAAAMWSSSSSATKLTSTTSAPSS